MVRKPRRVFTWIAFLTPLATAMACQVHVKVDRQTKDVGTPSSLEGDSSQTASWAQDPEFIDALNNLKGVAVRKLIDEYASGDYRKKFREGFRYYRRSLLTRALDPQGPTLDLYRGDVPCRKADLRLEVDRADGALGMILQTAVLAGLSEGGARALDMDGASSDVRSIVALIKNDLRVEATGDVRSETSSDGRIMVGGKMKLRLLPLAEDDPSEDEDLRAEDLEGQIAMEFERAWDPKTTLGTFVATIEVGGIDPTSRAKVMSLTHLDLTRAKNDAGNWTYEAKVSAGLKDQRPIFERTLLTEEVGHTIRMTDTYTLAGGEASTFVSVFDRSTGEQCLVDPEKAQQLITRIEEIENRGKEDSTPPPPTPAPTPTIIPEPTPAPMPTPTPTPSMDPGQSPIQRPKAKG